MKIFEGFLRGLKKISFSTHWFWEYCTQKESSDLIRMIRKYHVLMQLMHLKIDGYVNAKKIIWSIWRKLCEEIVILSYKLCQETNKVNDTTHIEDVSFSLRTKDEFQ